MSVNSRLKIALIAEPILSPTGPPIAPLPSAVKVYNQDSDVQSPVGEEPSVAAEASRPRPSTVTVIHTGTKWRQVPREVSWETTELWDGIKPSRDSTSSPSLPIPQPPHLSLPNHGRNLRSVGSAPFTTAQHGTALLPFPLSYRPGSTGGKMLTRSCGSHVQPGSWLSGRQTSSWSGSATLKGTLYRSCYHFGLRACGDEHAPLYALCKYPARNRWVESCYASEI